MTMKVTPACYDFYEAILSYDTYITVAHAGNPNRDFEELLGSWKPGFAMQSCLLSVLQSDSLIPKIQSPLQSAKWFLSSYYLSKNMKFECFLQIQIKSHLFVSNSMTKIRLHHAIQLQNSSILMPQCINDNESNISML